MHLNPIFARGPANREALRGLMATAKRDFLFAEVEFTGPGASTLVFVAGRVAHGRRRGQDRPDVAAHTAATLHDHTVDVLAGVLQSSGGFYRCHPLAGVRPSSMPFTYDAIELLDAALETAGGADPVAEAATEPVTAVDVDHLAARAASLRAELRAEADRPQHDTEAPDPPPPTTRRGALTRLIRSLAG